MAGKWNFNQSCLSFTQLWRIYRQTFALAKLNLAREIEGIAKFEFEWHLIF